MYLKRISSNIFSSYNCDVLSLCCRPLVWTEQRRWKQDEAAGQLIKKRHFKLGELTHNSAGHFISFLWKILILPYLPYIHQQFSTCFLKEPRKPSLTERNGGHMKKLTGSKVSYGADIREFFLEGHYLPPCRPRTIRATWAAAPAALVPPTPLGLEKWRQQRDHRRMYSQSMPVARAK